MNSDLAARWRSTGATQNEIASMARLAQGTLSKVFAGKRTLSLKAEARLRDALADLERRAALEAAALAIGQRTIADVVQTMAASAAGD